jgi:hypothetical protein
MKRSKGWMTLASSIVVLVFSQATEAVAAANCDDISAGYWGKNRSLALEMAKARWEQCARSRSGTYTRFETSQASTVDCKPFRQFGYAYGVRELDCGYGGRRGDDYVCTVSGVVCSRY